jgi:hypothetical protein
VTKARPGSLTSLLHLRGRLTEFRFLKERVANAMAAFRALAAASARKSGDLCDNINRSTVDEEEFCVVELRFHPRLWRHTNLVRHSSASVESCW